MGFSMSASTRCADLDSGRNKAVRISETPANPAEVKNGVDRESEATSPPISGPNIAPIPPEAVNRPNPLPSSPSGVLSPIYAIVFNAVAEERIPARMRPA